MCTRFVYRGDDMITGFNFDIDLAVWNHQVIEEKDRFYIGILRPDGIRHSYHGVNRNGNVGTLLYVHGNPAGAYQTPPIVDWKTEMPLDIYYDTDAGEVRLKSHENSCIHCGSTQDLLEFKNRNICCVCQKEISELSAE